MTTYYLDSSALLKRYVRETGSIWLRQITDETAQNAILISEITLAEIAAALAAKSRMPGGISQKFKERALSRFLDECDKRWVLLQIEQMVIDQAVILTQKYRLRGYDAVQLARALVTNRDLVASNLSALTFVATDKDLLSAAQAENLLVELPENH